jgi:CheY-like chemotaxis protein/DNA-directed RNA polymerase specialized sigma24 family protein
VWTSHGIAQYLPYLRRYARALAGTQSSGDAYVVASLEAILREPHLLSACEKPRVALFRVFTTIWNSVAINGVSDPPGDPSATPDRRLGHITPRACQTFLLISLEGFSEAEAASILDTNVVDVRGLVDQASREMAVEIATDVLVIEDEPLIAMHLQGLVERIGHRIAGNARTHHEAVALARFKKPGLILADIQLADGSSGLDAVNELLGSFEVPVIFITAHPQRFLTGERPEPAFLITKPYQPATISAVVSQALFFERSAVRRGRYVTA